MNGSRDRQFRAAGWFFALGSAVHLADHLRRGQSSVSEELYLLGNLALILQVVLVTLILTRHGWAPRLAVVAGPLLAIGFLGAHWVPEWSVISDPVWAVESLPALSMAASLLEVVGALAVAVTGWLVLRSHQARELRITEPRIAQ